MYSDYVPKNFASQPQNFPVWPYVPPQKETILKTKRCYEGCKKFSKNILKIYKPSVIKSGIEQIKNPEGYAGETYDIFEGTILCILGVVLDPLKAILGTPVVIVGGVATGFSCIAYKIEKSIKRV